MAWTFDPKCETDRDLVRLKIGDIEEREQLIADEVIDYLLSTTGSVLGAALSAARAIHANLAKQIDSSATGVSLSLSRQFYQYGQVLDRLEQESTENSTTAPIYAGGVFVADKDRIADDERVVQPVFARTTFGEEGGGTETS